jgi:preprotein translocase subunit SecE
MARDRQRAKQRRDRARRTGSPSERAARGPRPSADRDGLSRAEAEDTLEAPEPLDHSSAEIDLVNAQLAVGRPELADEIPVEDADPASADELDEEADAVAAGRRRRPARVAVDEDEDPGELAGTAPARVERHAARGGRVGSFLLASWRELQRVQWPDRRQVAQATGVVLGFVLVAGAFLGVAGWLASRLVKVLVG